MDYLDLSTTDSIAGKKVEQTLGIAYGEAILGANIFRDIFASIRNVVGGRVGGYEKEMKSTRDTAMAELTQSAMELGANAIIGVSLDYEVIGSEGGSMLMVCATGTAVKVS